MREIKFRLWTYDEDEKRNVMMEVPFGSYVPDEIMASSQVMQYTGLKDKNTPSVCIYEGDLISLDGKVIGNVHENSTLIGQGAYLIIEGLGTKAWRDTEQRAMELGCYYSE